jgi:PAS domain S-box-containing protein
MSPTVTQEWLCQRIVAESSLAIIYGDQQGIIRLWNSGAEEMFGWQAAEAIGQSMDIIVPEKHRARHWDGYHKVMQTGVTKYGRAALAVPALRKDGSRISIEFFIVLVRDGEGKLQGCAALISDVTARWEREKETKTKIAALESRIRELEKAAP